MNVMFINDVTLTSSS